MPALVLDGRDLPIDAEPVIIGRHRACGLPLADESASRQHCKVFREQASWWVEDLGSANGTLINGERIAGRHPLADGDCIVIGATSVVFKDDGTVTVAKARQTGRTTSSAHRRFDTLSGAAFAGYQIRHLIGVGPLGAVYRASQLALDRDVAIKVFNPTLVAKQEGLDERFRREAGRIGAINHPGLSRMHEAGVDGDLMWCSMEWVEGQTLAQILERDRQVQPAMALLVAEQIALACQAAHDQGMVHGDIRPNTVMVTGDGRVKLTDIGMAAIFEAAELDPRGQARQAWYMSPQQAVEGSGHPGDDIYSLGCVLYHLLVGKPPYDGVDAAAVLRQHAESPIPEIKGALGQRVSGVLQSMLTKNRAWRHASMKELAAELRTVREALGEQAVAPVVQVRQQRAQVAAAKRQAAKHYQTATIAGVVLILGAVAWFVVPVITARRAAVADGAAPEPMPALVQPATPAVAVSPAPPVVQPKPAPPAVQPKPAPPVAVDPWPALQERIQAALSAQRFREAETLTAQAPTSAKAQAGLLQEQIRRDAETWYRQWISSLPTGTTAADHGERLRRAEAIATQVPAAMHAELEARREEASTLLTRALDQGTAEAQAAVRRGDGKAVARAVAGLVEAGRGTPLAGRALQLAARCGEAARIAGPWAGLKAGAEATTGEARLTVTAAAGLVGDEALAVRLGEHPSLSSGALLRRREALFGRTALALSFSDPQDLQAFEVRLGQPRITPKGMTAAADEPLAIELAQPLGGERWEMQIDATLAAGGELILSLGEQAQMRLGDSGIEARVAASTAKAARPGQAIRLTVARHGARLDLSSAGATIVSGAVDGSLPVRLDLSGTWTLTGLKVISR